MGSYSRDTQNNRKLRIQDAKEGASPKLEQKNMKKRKRKRKRKKTSEFFSFMHKFYFIIFH
jgi:hypothetical protein